ncbi:uncharacterized protein J3D65DRAFT_615946 [Phyllosticta citribraziliensis]|uniref:FAS1 domain-containing protein n=1 Tax=Phyllosticta citribraziliensis TaxID=989973 RepID=A0ABR1LZJ7_9PEZI
MRAAFIHSFSISSLLLLFASARAGPLFLHRLDQAPIANAPGIVLPPMDTTHDPKTGEPILSDIVGRDRSINIFSGFTRDVDAVSARLDDSNKNATILAPHNSAIASLPRKPWEDPKDYDSLGSEAYAGAEGSGRANKNLQTFVNAHIVPRSPWPENEKVETVAGNTVWYEVKDGKKFIQPGNIEVLSVADKVANGQLWILKDVLNYGQ